MKFYIRTFYNPKYGLGNYERVKRFAYYLKKNEKNKVIFLLDTPNKLDDQKFTNYYIYRKEEKFISDTDDANRVLKIIKDRNSIIILDDPRLNFVWEKKINKIIKNLIIIKDNLHKKHYCKILINSHASYSSKYWDTPKLNDKYSESTNLLLGPKYFFKKNIKILTKKKYLNNKIVKIGLYNGSSGNFLNFLNLIKYSYNKKLNFKFNIIIGNQSKISKKENYIYEKLGNVKLHFYPKDPEKTLAKNDLVFLPESMVMMDLSILKIPLIIYNLNKKLDSRLFESLGNYFIFDKTDIENYTHICKFIKLLSINIQRLKKMINRSAIDSNGCKRVLTSINEKNRKVNGKEKNINNHLIIQKIDDTHINNYLISRNLKINRSNSINKNKISNLEHYNWWFKNKRNIFFAKKNKKILFYLYDSVVKFEKISFILPGFLNCNIENDVFDVLKILKWQNNRINKLKLKGKCICLVAINSNNKFSNLQTKLFKYNRIKKNSDQIILDFIKKMNINKNFNFYYRQLNGN